MRYILLITFIVLRATIACAQSVYDTYVQPPAETDSLSLFFSAAEQQFHVIEELRFKQKNTLLTAGLKYAADSIPRLIESWKRTIMQLKDTFDFNMLTIVKSQDSAFCIVSWDTRLGDSKTDYASVVLYKKDDSIYVQQQQQEFVKGKPENPKIRYTAVYTIKEKEKNIYLAKGYGQGRNTEPWQEIKSFCITDSLQHPRIFPKKSYRIFVAVNTTQLRGIKKTPPLSFNSSTQRLIVPVTDKENIFTGSYITYRYSAKGFKKVRDKDVVYSIAAY